MVRVEVYHEGTGVLTQVVRLGSKWPSHWPILIQVRSQNTMLQGTHAEAQTITAVALGGEPEFNVSPMLSQHFSKLA